MNLSVLYTGIVWFLAESLTLNMKGYIASTPLIWHLPVPRQKKSLQDIEFEIILKPPARQEGLNQPRFPK
ncbi:MAG: hypothetical protein COT59_00670 [Candidatus Nealsonbacteria bacterium CG09_land_8_20_14_0_10_42_14]|uniref:Uncharacterized protein n=1 Tax=Candidatus Nealsonbacteria bacterium CG09_land_8_20_14_0_10_42_14 TaxID=1974707 RepID=A0A2H0WXN8_9BACT|nr:MAG: hypothetical protein COT59_00670 [Candidatus Nealsonbacteria bacterium CG09_land_8_20_14_0_10_42_14]